MISAVLSYVTPRGEGDLSYVTPRGFTFEDTKIDKRVRRASDAAESWWLECLCDAKGSHPGSPLPPTRVHMKSDYSPKWSPKRTPRDEEVVTPYAAARTTWNKATSLNSGPWAVVQASAAEHALRAVSCARLERTRWPDRRRRLCAIAGAHGFEGDGSCNGGVLVDVGGLRRSSLNPERSEVTFGSGFTIGQIVLALNGSKRVMPRQAGQTHGVQSVGVSAPRGRAHDPARAGDGRGMDERAGLSVVI